MLSCGATHEFEQPKILYQEIATYQSFAWDATRSYTNNKTFLTPETSHFLLGILNARPTWFFLGLTASKLQGGAYQMQTPYVSQIPIPTSGSNTAITGLVERILALKAADGRADVSGLEGEINERVYALYGLRPDEIRMIEEQVGGGGAG